ncbi:unnamed protein product [Thlaspi arvense]|uniref:Uncharacterized protein n=1 Tax=Thlaspi arvense TaxID=13288 RepID=A0AAU9SLG1_THLAR|nr:unnamed protein product [Thlaspi arvense]
MALTDSNQPKLDMHFALIYAKANDKSGPLKPGADSYQDCGRSCVPEIPRHPVEVDIYVIELDRRFPPIVKQVSAEAISAAQITPIVACAFASKVSRCWHSETASGIANLEEAELAGLTSAFCSENTVVKATEKAYTVQGFIVLVIASYR